MRIGIRRAPGSCRQIGQRWEHLRMELLPHRHCLSADETLARCRHDPVRALIDMEDFYAHTPVSLPPCSSRVWLELPTWGRVTLTQPELGVIGRGWYPGATKPSVGDGLAALHTPGPGSPRDESTEMKTRNGVRAVSTVRAVPAVIVFALGTTRLHHQEM